MLVLSFHADVGDQAAPDVQKEEPLKSIFVRKNLPYFAAIVQAGLFSYAGMKFFGSFGWVVGFGVGMIVNYSLALAASHISDIAAKRKPLAYVALVAMFSLSPVTICSTLGWSIGTFAWAMCVDLSIVLSGAIVGKSLIAQESRTPPKSDRTPAKSARSASQYPRKCAHCPEMLYSPNAVGGHMKKNHPQMCKGALAENLFQNAK